MTTNKIIIKNSTFCWRCRNEVESTRRHEFVACACCAIYVDGGHDYLRRGCMPGAVLTDTSIIYTIRGE